MHPVRRDRAAGPRHRRGNGRGNPAGEISRRPRVRRGATGRMGSGPVGCGAVEPVEELGHFAGGGHARPDRYGHDRHRPGRRHHLGPGDRDGAQDEHDDGYGDEGAGQALPAIGPTTPLSGHPSTGAGPARCPHAWRIRIALQARRWRSLPAVTGPVAVQEPAVSRRPGAGPGGAGESLR